MKSSASKITLAPLDYLFGASDSVGESFKEIPLTELHEFCNHPFKVLDDESMQMLVESVIAKGILVPGIARPKSDGGYELIAGHRRRHACELAGLDTMPVVILELSDDESTIYMVDSNIQREMLLPSEKAWAYKMKLDAMKRQGSRIDLTSRQVVGKLESADLVGKNCGESGRQIQRYIRLTELIQQLLDMVDSKSLAFNPAVSISYISQGQQEILFAFMQQLNCSPTLEQAEKIKKYGADGKLSAEVIEVILSEEKLQPVKVTLKSERLKKYFPVEYTPQQMETVIFELLETWQGKQSP